MNTASGTRDPDRFSGLRILLADDHPVVRQVAREVLESLGISVESAVNGHDVVERVADHGERLDAILMDIQMPVLNGYEACREIRRRYSRERLPIIAMTVNDGPEERERCLAAGMNEQISKPIDMDQLLATLATVEKRETIAGLPPEQRANTGRVPASPSAHPLPGINLPVVLARAQGNRRLVGQLIRLFVREHGGAAYEIEQLIRAGALPEAAQITHRLRGGAANLAAERLQAATQALEDGLQTGDVAGAEHALHRFRQALAEICSGADTLDLAPEEASGLPGPDETSKIPELLDELEHLLARHSLDLAAPLESLRRALGAGEARSSLEGLTEMIWNLDYPRALACLREVRARYRTACEETR